MTNLHIELATKVFSQPESAAAEFRHMLPPYLVETIDWSTLRRESTVADPELQDNEGDLLFSARLINGKAVLLRMLLKGEKSLADEFIGMRLARHAERQIRHWRKQHPEIDHMPLLIPLIVYFGKKPWNASRRNKGLSGLLN